MIERSIVILVIVLAAIGYNLNISFEAPVVKYKAVPIPFNEI